MTQSPDGPEDPTNPPPPPSWAPGPDPDPEPPHGDPLTGHGEHQQPLHPPPGPGQPHDAGYPPGQYGAAPYEPPQYAGYQPPQYNPGYPQQQYGYDPAAPYGIDPKTGIPFSDKSKLIAGLLQVLLPLGIGRMYLGQTGMGVAQLLVTVFTCGVGAIWPFVDGILILVGDQRDAQGRPLRS